MFCLCNLNVGITLGYCIMCLFCLCKLNVGITLGYCISYITESQNSQHYVTPHNSLMGCIAALILYSQVINFAGLQY